MWAAGERIKYACSMAYELYRTLRPPRHRRDARALPTQGSMSTQVAADSDVIAGGTKVPARGSVVDRLPDKTCKA